MMVSKNKVAILINKIISAVSGWNEKSVIFG